jgi:hypothetical protein
MPWILSLHVKEKIQGINCHWQLTADESRQNELAHANFLAIIEHNYKVAHFTYHFINSRVNWRTESSLYMSKRRSEASIVAGNGLQTKVDKMNVMCQLLGYCRFHLVQAHIGRPGQALKCQLMHWIFSLDVPDKI